MTIKQVVKMTVHDVSSKDMLSYSCQYVVYIYRICEEMLSIKTCLLAIKTLLVSKMYKYKM